MKSGIKELVQDAFESTLASSKIVDLLLTSVKTIAKETKKLAEGYIQLNERLNQHEKALEILCELQNEKAGLVNTTRQSKDGSKPN